MYSDQHKHFQMICPDIALLYRIYIYSYNADKDDTWFK